MKTLILIAVALVAIQAVSVDDLVQEQWKTFKLTYGKQYKSETEESFRMNIYIENMHKIAVHNQRYELGHVSFELGPNKYADMLHQEFVNTMNGFNRTGRLRRGNHMVSYTFDQDDGITYIPPDNVELPTYIDWRKKGAVTAIKDQGECGSCWSFSATGALEGQHFRKTNKLVSLSEQNLVDCSSKFGNHGCEGGLMDNAFKYIKYNRGIDTEQSYPYEALDEKCHYNPKDSGATDRGYTDIESGSEEKLQSAVATIGPVSVAIDASHDSFQFYSKGVYNEPACSSDPYSLDHGVLAVGYGSTKDGVDYWIVKNSWGTSWGQEGYILMSRNKSNQCGIATEASYPLV